MMDTECVVLYTHQKLKKAKTWHDGVLKILTPGTRAILYDDKKNKIDTVHIKPEAIVCGEQLESDRHLILIEEIKSSIGHGQVPVSDGQSGGREQHVIQTRPHVPTTSVGTGGRLSMRTGIKRRKTGFVPPRMVKQPRLDEYQTDACDTGYNNPTVRSNPSFYTNTVQSNPDTASILSLYSRTGAAKAIDSIPPPYKQSAEPSYTSSLQSNTEPLVATPPDQRLKNQSPLLGHLASDETPGTASHPPSPWSSFGAGRLKSLGSDSPRSKEGGTNEQLLNGTRSSNCQNNYSRTTNFCERNTPLPEKDQSSYNKGSGFAHNACANSQRTFSKLPIADTSTGNNAATKRSASQIMALLGRSRKRDLIRAVDERQSESQYTETSQDSSGLPVSQDDSILPVSRDSSILPVSHDSSVLPVSQDDPILPVLRDISILPVSEDDSVLPVSQENSILPVSLPYQMECDLDKTDHHKPIDHRITVTGVGLSASGKQITSYNNTRFVESHKVMQHQASIRTSYHGEMQDLSSDFDISLSSSSGTPNKQPDSIEVTPVDVKAYTKLEQCRTEGDMSTKETDVEKDMYRGRVCQEQVSVQDSINKEATSENFHENDLLKHEKSEEGIDSEPKIEQYGYKGTVPGKCSYEDMENKSTENDLAAMFECNEKERPDSHLSDDDNDNIVLGQQASFLISYSPLSQVSNSDDEDDVHSSHNIDEDPKQKTVDGETQEYQVVERKDEWIDRTENPCKVSSGETNIQLSDSSEDIFFHISDVDPKQIALEDGGTQEEQFVEKRDERIDKNEILGKMSEETNIQITDSSEGKHAERRDCQSSEDKNASQVPNTEEYQHDRDALVDPDVTKEQFSGLNDLNFSPDSVAFASLSSVEGREENNKLNVNSWQTKQTLPGSHLVTDIPRFAVTSPKSTNQVFSKMNVSSLHPTSQDTLLRPDIMRNVTNITPGCSGKCNDESISSRFETTPHECTPSDVSESDQEGFGKSYSLPSSGGFSSQCKEVSMLQGSEEITRQTESVTTKFDTPPTTGFVNTQCVENTSQALACHSSENSCSRELPATEMSYHYDNIPVRTKQEQDNFVEPMRSHCVRLPANMENCSTVEDHLPHPSQLLRRPNVTSNTTAFTIPPMDEEDPFTDGVDPGPIENATQKLQQYKVRGSISGGVARRTSKSASGLDYHHTRSPTLSAMGNPATRENLFCSMSPSQTLENASFPPDQDDHSVFIDWNVGKPQLVDMTTLCNAQDIKIPDSPYQNVPIACGSPQSYDDGCEGRNMNDVPDIDFGRTKTHDSHITAGSVSLSHCFSDKSSPGVFTPGCDLQSVPSGSNRLPCEAESPTYGNMFREKRNMIGCDPGDKINKFCSNLDKPIVVKKEKVSLKCKPFEDSFTHTSYSSSYFSPARVDSRDYQDDPTSMNFRGQKDIPANVDSKHHKDTLSGVDTRGQKKILDKVDFRGQMDTTKYVRHMYSDSELDIQGGNDNNSNREQSVKSECSPEKKSDLHLSLSSVGSSDLELSFTLTEHYQGQSKPSTDLPGDNQLYASSNIETGNLRSNAISDFKSSQTCEEKISCAANQYNDSKWGKFIIKEDQDDDLIFDGSFDEQYKAKKFDNRMNFKSVGESRRMTLENSDQLQCCNKSNNDMYVKSTVNTTNSHSPENLLLSGQKTYTGIHDMQKHTMSSLCGTNQRLTPAIPPTGSTDVSPTMAEKENEISQDFLMDDFDMQETEDMIVSSTFSEQNSAKPDSHMVPPSVSSAAVGPVAESDVIPPRSRSVIFQNTSAALSKREVFFPRQNAMKKSPSLSLTPVAECDILSQRQNSMKKFHSPVPSAGLVTHVMKGSKRNISGELQFASKEEVDSNPVPLREVSISVNFPTVAVYKQVLTAVLKEHLNIILFGQAQQYHHALGMVDISSYSPAQHQGPLMNKAVSTNKASTNPNCQCGVPSKMVQVKKAGNNKGRFFYACNSARNNQCKYFQWVDQTGGGRTSTTGGNKLKLCEASSINTYMRGNHIMFYCECELLKKTASDITSHFKKGVPNWVKMKYQQTNQDKKKLYIKLSKKDASSLYSKDDLWIISTTLNFHPSQTFLAKSAYFGPNSSNEVEIEPLAGFSPSNWPNHAFCHALLAGNITSELCYLSNIEDNMNPASLPILPCILDSPKTGQRELSQQGGFKAPVRTAVSQSNIFATKTSVMELAEEFIQSYKLNTDQSSALMRVCHMFYGSEKGPETDPVLLIHGVFGAGKSFLLSVIVLFLVRLFEVSDSYTPGVPYPWKVLISSTTNVAVDRILLGLLEIGFEDFVRVGSMKKISKPVLPFSVHATGSESQELKDLQEMLRSGELTPSEKHNVRQSIEKHRLGENKKRLSKVRVVGVTCASCRASSLDKMTFPVVLLDESSQMTEPASMLPIAKFGCEKLLLVGDPKQLDPTIQGSEAAHSNGLEQTLFDRLIKMGHSPTVLHTQYRCHPVISNLANTLFYDGRLIDGVTSSDREPLVPEIPTLCFYDVSGGQEQADDGGSFYNEKEAVFVTSLIQELLVRGVEPASIGVITLYKSQMYKINTSLLTNVKSDSNEEIKATRVSTVDAFQGGEHDIIILSCVRTKGIGFIDNHKRTNVALTRARHHLLIVGKKSNLSKNQLWCQVLQLCGRQPGGVCEADTFLQHLGNTEQDKSQDRMGSTPCSPPMSLSSQETYSVTCSPQHETGNAVTGSESPPLTPPADTVVSVRRKCRVINADLLECSEASDSDEDLPTF